MNRAILLCLVFFFPLFTACGRDLLLSRKAVTGTASSYCSLLYIPFLPQAARAQKPFLGISIEPVRLSKDMMCKGSAVRVATVLRTSPADKAGLRKGDILLSINGAPVCGKSAEITDVFRDMVAAEEVGSVIRVGVLRGGEEKDIEVLAEARPLCSMAEAEDVVQPECSKAEASLLYSALKEEDALEETREILAGLRENSGYLHNMDRVGQGRCNPFQLKTFNSLIRHPFSAAEAAKDLSERMTGYAGDLRLDHLMRISAELVDVEMRADINKAPATLQTLLTVMEETKKGVEKALSGLSPAEKALLREKAIEPWNDGRWNEVLDLSVKLDMKGIYDALAPLAAFLWADNLSAIRRDIMERFGSGEGILFDSVTPVGRVVIGGTGSNTYREDAAVILDLGGDDLYLNNAGGTREGMPVSLVIDWEGNDRYLARESVCQGAGVLGGGLLLDLSGDDTFSALDAAQGAGLFGLGILYHGDGRALFRARKLSQGVGQAGIGILQNGRGNSSYSCLERGQALGLFGGAGILIDRSGNDSYELGGLEADFRDPERSTVSMGQGFGKGFMRDGEEEGVSGGIGLLIDEEGNDIYMADYFAQGGAYYFGVGILDDRSGDDRYIAGRYAQAAGIHSSVGVLLDRGGDDSYYSSFGVGQGMGHDFGVGFLEDGGGDDSYSGGMLLQGAATRGGIGLLLDKGGADDFAAGREGGGYAADRDCLGILIHTAARQIGAVGSGEGPSSVRLGLKRGGGPDSKRGRQ